MEKLTSIFGLPILSGVFVLIVGGALGVIFTLAGNTGTIIIGLAIVILAPIIAAAFLKRNEAG